MTSHCDSDWLHDIAAREFHEGLAAGVFIGLVIAGVFVACIISAALSEAHEGARGRRP